MSQSATSTVLRHLDGCMNSNDPTPCFLAGGTCQADHVIGGIPHVNNDTATTVLTRVADSIGGVSSHVTTWFTEFHTQLNLCLTVDQADKLADLLKGAVAVHRLYAADDAALHAQVTK